MNVLFRCDGSREVGLGHVVRCLALAGELRKRPDCRVVFAMREGPIGTKMVEERGFAVLSASQSGEQFDYARWIREAVSAADAAVLVLDVRDDLPIDLIKQIRKEGVLIVTIDDPSERRLAADLAFYPPVPQVKRLDWRGFTGELFAGWEWVILRPEFADVRQMINANPKPETQDPGPVILITMGGTDPKGMTLKVVEAMNMVVEEFRGMVVLGPGFSGKERLSDLLVQTGHVYDIHEGVEDMSPLMAQADLAIASFGVTAYELAAMEVPAVYLCLTEDHSESASVFADAGIGINLGCHDKVLAEDLCSLVSGLLAHRNALSAMAMHAHGLVDGQGAKRIAGIVGERIHHA